MTSYSTFASYDERREAAAKAGNQTAMLAVEIAMTSHLKREVDQLREDNRTLMEIIRDQRREIERLSDGAERSQDRI